jgi:hypothetical protein
MPKDLSHYIDNPADMSQLSAEQLETLMSGGDIADTSTSAALATPAEPVAPATPAAPAAADPAAPAPAAPDPNTPAAPNPDAVGSTPNPDPALTPDGVLAKDGKHILPFKVVEELRSSNKDMLDRLTEQSAQLATLQAEKAGGAAAPVAAAVSEEDLAALEADGYGALAKVLRSQQAQIVKLTGELQGDREARAADSRQTRTETVQDAIDAVPKLAALQALGEKEFGRAQRIDALLSDDPEWSGKSLSERFAQVAKVYESMYGDIKLPTADTPAAAADPASPAADLTPAPARRVPASMSDIPGGSMPAVDALAEVENASAPELTQRFLAMAPDKIEAFLARL